MMSMDISALGAAPSPDTAGASADAPEGAADLFAAMLDEAAGTAGDSREPSDEQNADEEDAFDELAALAMTSLLSLPTPVTDTVNGEAVGPTADDVVGCHAV